MNFENAIYPSPEQAREFFGSPENGPFVMLNLLKFKPFATYADGSDAQLSGAEAYARYGVEVAKLLVLHGGRVRYSGDITSLMLGIVDGLWDAVAMAEYPSYAAFMAMASSPAYKAIEHHRIAGLDGQLNIRTQARIDAL